MAITPLPIPPLRSDPTNFAARGDAFLGALPKFQVEANALAAAMNLNSTTDSSTSSITIGTGDKTFVVSSGKSFQPGMYLVIADVAAPSTNSLFGQITSYSGTSLVMSIISVRGSGTKSSWVISQSSAGGAQAGPLASSGITGAAASGPLASSGITGAAASGPLASSGITGAAASGANTDITSITGNAATATTAVSNVFLTAGTGAYGVENIIGAKCTGFSPAYLYNNGYSWGLQSESGGLLIEYNRGTGKTYMYGTATTANNLNGTNHNVLGSKLTNTNYSNSSGKTMIVTISLADAGGPLATLFVDNSPVCTTQGGSLTAVVPNGSFYLLLPGNTSVIYTWCEYH